jgi:peptidoglycan-associated lipoprotein
MIMRLKHRLPLIIIGISLVVLAAGCKKKVAVAPPAPPPPVQEAPPPAPAAPTASLSAEPSTIEAGQPVTLAWSSTDATGAVISGIGEVAFEGKQEVRPEKTTTYELVVKGPGGSTTTSATVSVMAPPPPVIVPAPLSKSLEDRIASELSDAYFDYDKSDIRGDARATLAKDAEALRSILDDFPSAVVVLEGHCDERGSAEYNLGLGDRRTTSANEYLQALGIDAARLKTISYGKERPQCTESTEDCRQSNRRVRFSALPSPGTN